MATSVSSVVSHFPEAENGFTTTTAGSVSSGAATVTLNSVAGYTNGEPVVLVIDPTDAAKKQTFTGIVDTGGVQVTSVVWTAGTNQTHALGATVVDYATATHISMISKGIKVSHNQDGTMITSLPLTTPKVTTSINDSNGNEVIKTPATASAVNEITVTNAATGNAPSISATGGDSTAHLNLRGKGLAKTVTIGAGATVIFPYDYVVSGCVWSGDAYASTLAASMTAGVVVINGNPITVAAVTARAFTASKDVYIDVLDNGDGTGLLVYTDNTINAASPALASNSIRLGIIVTGAGSIASAASVNQGQEDKVVPIASSIPYAVTDSLGNLICPRDPRRRILGYRQVTSNYAPGTTAETVVVGLTVPVIIPSGGRVRVTVHSSAVSGSTGVAVMYARNGTTTGGTLVAQANGQAANIALTPLSRPLTLTGSQNFCAAVSSTASNPTVTSTSTAPSFIMVELV